MNITVYLASSTGNDSKFEEAVKELGSWIGVSGNTLVYGGSKTGLMGDWHKAFCRQAVRLSAWSRSFL